MNNSHRLITALVAIGALLIGSTISSSAVAQTRPTLQGLQDQVNILNTQINTLNTQINTLNTQINTINSQVNNPNPAPPCADTVNRYVDCGNGTVTDTVTGLIWLQNANCFGLKNYPDAIAAAAGLKSGDCGLNDNSKPGDWRLPTIAEWEAMTERAVELNCKGANSPTLTNTPGTGCFLNGPQPFFGVQLTFYPSYWESSSVVEFPSSARLIGLDGPNGSVTVKSSTGYVWPVRAVPAGQPAQ